MHFESTHLTETANYDDIDFMSLTSGKKSFGAVNGEVRMAEAG